MGNMKIKIYDRKGQEKGEQELSDSIFAAEIRPGLVHQVVVAHLANQRQGTSATKTRGQVRGGGKKPWRQKGTGRARHGSIRSPIWRGGGHTFAKVPREFRHRTPVKVKRAALASVLSHRAAEGRIRLLDELAWDDYSTRGVVTMLKTLGYDKQKVLILVDHYMPKLVASVRNIPTVTVEEARNLNTYMALWHDNILATTAAAAQIGGGAA
jgi:large subunit ribosomal protein L4